MTEKEKMQSQKLYDANYDPELGRERIECKVYVRNIIICR